MILYDAAFDNNPPPGVDELRISTSAHISIPHSVHIVNAQLKYVSWRADKKKSAVTTHNFVCAYKPLTKWTSL